MEIDAIFVLKIIYDNGLEIVQVLTDFIGTLRISEIEEEKGCRSCIETKEKGLNTRNR